MQPHYWGGERWEKEWNRRTYVEGVYGNLKNPSTEDIRRGYIRVTGLARHNLGAGLAALSYNLRSLRSWYEGNKDNLPPDHPLHHSPLVQPGPSQDEVFSHIPVDREEATRIAEQQLRRRQGANT